MQENIYGIPGRAGPFEQMAQNRMFGGTPEDQYSEDYFKYVVFFEGLAPATTARGSVTIQKDADFEWLLSSHFAFVAASDPVTVDTVEVPLVNVEIIDNGSGRNLQNLATPVFGDWGDGKLPYVLPQPRIFKATSTVTFNATSVATLTTYNLFLILHGVKIFNYNLRRGVREMLAAQEAAAVNGAR